MMSHEYQDKQNMQSAQEITVEREANDIRSHVLLMPVYAFHIFPFSEWQKSRKKKKSVSRQKAAVQSTFIIVSS